MTDILTLGSLKDGFEMLLAELEIEHQTYDIGTLAERIFDAEAGDFYWAARTAERRLGRYQSLDEEEDRMLERVAILGWLRHRWFVAIVVSDGDGALETLLGVRPFASLAEAQAAFDDAR